MYNEDARTGERGRLRKSLGHPFVADLPRIHFKDARYDLTLRQVSQGDREQKSEMIVLTLSSIGLHERRWWQPRNIFEMRRGDRGELGIRSYSTHHRRFVLPRIFLLKTGSSFSKCKDGGTTRLGAKAYLDVGTFGSHSHFPQTMMQQ